MLDSLFKPICRNADEISILVIKLGTMELM